MGILTSGILGPMVNKTGAVIGRIHRGQNVITQLYKKKATKRIPSRAQLDSEHRLRLLSGFLSYIQGLIKTGFKTMIKHNSSVNAAYSYNFKHAFLTIEDQIVLNYSKIIYSLGDVEGPESPVINYNEGILDLSWLDLPQSEYCRYADRATILIYEPATCDFLSFDNVCTRGDLTVQLDITPFIGKQVHCYICFATEDDKFQGTSVYLGQILST